MKKVFAILHEPAAYTVERNTAVYDTEGVRYCYMNPSSLAKSEKNIDIEALSQLTTKTLLSKLRNILKNNDIVIMNGYTGKVFLLLYLLNIYYRKPIGLDSDTQLNIPNNLFKRIIKRAYLSIVFRDKNIYGLPGGTKTHYQLFQHYGMDESRICLMPMVVNNMRFVNDNRKSSEKFRFLYVGRIIEVKNLKTLLKAFVTAYQDNSETELRIVGNGNLLDELSSQYSKYPNISFAGAKYGKDLENEYKLATAFILPSSYEPWGLVVNEAMAAGLPIIVSNQVGAAWDLVEGQDTGFIFKYDDTKDLINKMIALTDDKKLYHTFSQNASKRVNEEWNYEFYTKCLKDFIEKASK